jgi:alkanesulfonate monooxygenase SsuD/methylene tetrahydromethanopterin reductase-like flavin-dependent oxidoreductase (luciferase family)
MKVALLSLVMNLPNSLTGELRDPHEELHHVIKLAKLAEKVGFDAFGVGERHGAPFLSSSPAVLLSSIATQTRAIRLLTMVSVLSILDPVRVAEDFATVDHLSNGRLELIIGKGNDPRHYPLFGLSEEEQWDSLAERYDLLKRLWTEENVSWEGRFRSPLYEVTTQPRPHQKTIRIWHGSASSKLSTELAAKNGDPLFSSNSFHPMEKYKTLIDHYKNRLEHYGHNPMNAIIGAGSGSLYLAHTTEEAIRRYRPYYEAFQTTDAAKHNHSPFRSLEDNIQNGPVLVGSPEQVIEKILIYQKAFGSQVLSVSVDGLTASEQEEQIERFAKEVAPVLRKQVPTSLWD